LFKTPDSAGDILEQISEKEDNRAWYPFNPIPNVRRFEVKLRGFDPIFAMFSIKRRFDPEIEFEKYINHPMNRYMEQQLKRLERARKSGNAKLYFKLGEILLRHSRVFFISQLQSTYPR
jgi:hypothetical protein